MAPKNNKPSKIDNQSKTMNYPIKKGEYIKEFYQAKVREYNQEIQFIKQPQYHLYRIQPCHCL